jgi:hypothetical protein
MTTPPNSELEEIEQLPEDWDSIAQVSHLTDKVNELVTAVNKLNAALSESKRNADSR